MKCVEKDGKILRVSNHQAIELVQGGGWHWCKKEKWKKLVRDVKGKPSGDSKSGEPSRPERDGKEGSRDDGRSKVKRNRRRRKPAGGEPSKDSVNSTEHEGNTEVKGDGR